MEYLQIKQKSLRVKPEGYGAEYMVPHCMRLQRMEGFNPGKTKRYNNLRLNPTSVLRTMSVLPSATTERNFVRVQRIQLNS